ncbi:hypothetical protein DMX07_03415 [Pseudomonas soli]|uniref:Uncharacterized protein n=1 Tax=Pseudomonas soli TaxID=1306993 RepID=A0A2V4IPR2_9PSED|nr:hypothetical protein DMX07_03415 [Pseudomonas soli]
MLAATSDWVLDRMCVYALGVDGEGGLAPVVEDGGGGQGQRNRRILGQPVLGRPAYLPAQGIEFTAHDFKEATGFVVQVFQFDTPGTSVAVEPQTLASAGDLHLFDHHRWQGAGTVQVHG